MDDFNRKNHWEGIYTSKKLEEVSWYQPTPEASLSFFKELQVAKDARIIDVGGGDSFLVDYLLELGYTEITVLDISEAAIDRAIQRLDSKASQVTWIVTDAASFDPAEKYDFWHDRAAFHFLTSEEEITHYLNTANDCLTATGIMVIGTFSDLGPKKCSGLEVSQYSERSMTERFSTFFERIKCLTLDHQTPSGSIQNFIFCSFKKVKGTR